MKTANAITGCARCRMNRRNFFATGGTWCAGAASYLATGGLASAAEGQAKTRIRIIYSLHGPKQTGPDWPNIGFDFVPVMERFEKELATRCPGFQFTPTLATGPEQAQEILDTDKAAPVDGYLVFQISVIILAQVSLDQLRHYRRHFHVARWSFQYLVLEIFLICLLGPSGKRCTDIFLETRN